MLKSCVRSVLLAILLASHAAGEEPALPFSEIVPPEWITFEIVPKPTWEAMAAANPPAKWGEDLGKNPAKRDYIGLIGASITVQRLQALCQRFPEQREKRMAAYAEMAQIYQGQGFGDRRCYWAWKLVEEFPDRPER